MKNKLIKSLIFDNNGVLTTTEEEAYKALSKLSRQKVGLVIRLWKELAKGVDEGRTSVDDFLKSLAFCLGIEDNLGDVRKIYYSQYVRDDEMHEVVKKLSKDYKVALLSNFGDAFDRFDKKWKSSETFGKNVFVSAKLKMRKPEAKAFQHVLKKMRQAPENAVFVDDRIENVRSAKKVGMEGILFVNSRDFIFDLLSLEKKRAKENSRAIAND